MLSVTASHVFPQYLHQAVGRDKGATGELIIQTAERLLAADRAVDLGVPASAKLRMTDFVGQAIFMLTKM